LFAPAFAVIFYKQCGFSLASALIFWCGIIQITLGAPFLLHAPINYISKSFELSRIFFYKWTVNLKFLPEDVFLSPVVSQLLLFMTLLGWSFVVYRMLKVPDYGNTPQQRILVCFTCNFIGVVFSRTLHYQFYSWYFFTIPALCAFAAFPRPRFLKLELPFIEALILIAIEIAFNVYPATAVSSLVLQMAHATLLSAVLWQYHRNADRGSKVKR
jgi:alpha-1,3-mannosyltransferase